MTGVKVRVGTAKMIQILKGCSIKLMLDTSHVNTVDLMLARTTTLKKSRGLIITKAHSVLCRQRTTSLRVDMEGNRTMETTLASKHFSQPTNPPVRSLWGEDTLITKGS